MLEKYRGYLVRHPAPPELAIDAKPFGYLDLEQASYRRAARMTVNNGVPALRHLRPYVNSEARKRDEKQPEHACYDVQKGKSEGG